MKKSQNRITVFQMICTALYILLFPVLMLGLSGDWLWPEGWIWCVWYTALCFVSIVYLYRKDPALLAERYKKPGTGNQKGWDRYVVMALVITFLGWVVLMPLDAKRYGWSMPFPLWLKVLGGVGLLNCSFFMYRSYTDNSFLSPLVRIQKERKQKVVSTGVYGFVRHPMYLGAISLFLGSPLLLGSRLGWLLGVGMSLLLAGRIIGEEKMLSKELKGYKAYTQKVRYRLIPGLW
jgi:protein-S-isoprenylcysteine O-methyltransferase Ste14